MYFRISNAQNKEMGDTPELVYLVKDKLTWNKQSILALLSAYETNNIQTDNTRKNKKFWDTVALDVNAICLFPVPVSAWCNSVLAKDDCTYIFPIFLCS